MRKTRVLLSMEHGQFSELLHHALGSLPTVDLIEVGTDPVECMVTLAATVPDLWIHGWQEGPQIQAMLSHIYQYHPSLTVVRLNPDEAAGYVLTQINSLSDLLELTNISSRALHTA